MNNERGVGFGVVLGNGAFTLIALFSLILGGWDRVTVVIIAALYFPVSTSAMFLAASGGLRDVMLAWIDHVTHRLELRYWFALRQQAQRRDQARGGPSLDEFSQIRSEITSVKGRVLPSRSTTFVPAYPPARQVEPAQIPAGNAKAMLEAATREQARAWLVSLFDPATGDLDDDKVHLLTSAEPPGRLKVKAPEGDVLRYLVAMGALKNIRNGYALDTQRIYTTRDIDICLSDAGERAHIL